jgi:hypothetical protein
MAWFRHRVEVTAAPAAAPKPRAGRPTAQPCSERGCQREHRVLCDYHDRRGNRCPTAWCPAHVVSMGDWRLCRRHARLSRALAPAEFRGELPAPDLDNRSPSLVAYVAEALDPAVRSLLTQVARPARDEVIGVDPLSLVVPRTGTRRWIQAWKLYDSTGPLLRIGLETEEDRDGEFALRLNGRVVLRSVPPWIAARRAGTATDEEDGAREGYFSTLMDQHLRPAVLAEERWMRRWEKPLPALARR